MKHLKRYNSVNENSVRLAADIFFSGKDGDWMSGINEPFLIKECSIIFPDSTIMVFNVLKEDFDSEFLNLKISPKQDYTNINSVFYLSIYGDNIQFESLNEYKFVRKYLTKADILEHTFDAYIYSDNHNGAFEIKLNILSPIDIGSMIMRPGIIGFHNNLMKSNTKTFVEKNKNWKSDITNFFDDYTKIQALYSMIENKIDSESIFEIKPCDIKIIDNLTIDGALYLKNILSGIKNIEILKEILRDCNSNIESNKYLKLIEEFL